MGEALQALLEREVDLLDLVVADAVVLALARDRLVRHHGGHQVGARLLDRLRTGLVDQVAVLDAAHPGLDRVAHRGAGVGVGQHVLADRAGLLHRRAHLLHRVLGGVELVAGGHRPARGHDLDLVHVVAQVLPGRLAHLLGSVRDHPGHADAALDGGDPLRATPLVRVPAGLRQRPPRDQHARARVEAALGGLAEAVVRAARVPHGGEALHQGLLHAAEGLGRDEAGRVVAVLLRNVALHRADVHVRVGEARHQRAAAEIDGVHLAGERAHLARGDHVLDAVALDHDRGAVEGITAGAVDEKRAREHGDRHGALREFEKWSAPEF